VHVRMAPEALARLTRRLTALLLVWGCVAAGCGKRNGDVSVSWKIDPMPPVAGAATTVRFTMRHEDGTPARGAALKLEGHMSHPGMTPVTADVTERGDGVYDARLRLSMAGDWVIVVSGELRDRSRITRSVEVRSVQPAGEQADTR
jgi:hypothetical protein